MAQALTFGGQPGIAPTQLPPPHLSLTLPSPQQPALNASTPGATVSPKVAEKILKGQFVDMTELLPDSWRWEDASVQLPSHCPPDRPPVTEITVWVEYFALMASVVISRFPEKAQHMFQYLRTIVCASRNFEGTAWVSYDAAFRRQSTAHLIGEQLTLLCTMKLLLDGPKLRRGTPTVCLIHMAPIHALWHQRTGNCRGKSLMNHQHHQGASQRVAFSTVQRGTCATTRIAGTHISVPIVGGAHTQHPNAHRCEGGSQGCSNRTDPKPLI